MTDRRWRNPYKTLPTLRAVVQGAYVAFFLLAGYEFHLYYTQIVAGADVTAHRAPAVEAFLPISALMSLKYFLLTGNFDEIHPAGLVILIAALVSAFLARKVLCSWVCPVGGISRALEWVGEKTIWKRRKKEVLLPAWADHALSAIKYLLLAFFLYAVVLKMDAMAIMKFQRGTYNYAADAKMLLFFTEMTGVTAVTLAILVLLSIVVKNFWCRYLCPYGALLGLVSWISPQRVVRDGSTCIDCKACTRACPVEIRVHEKPSVWTLECTGCMSCVAACPVEDCLTVTRRGKAGWSPYLIPLAGLGAIFLIWGAARVTGYWHGYVPDAQLAEAYRQAKEPFCTRTSAAPVEFRGSPIYPIFLIGYMGVVRPGGDMRLSKKTEYALRALMYAARFPEGTTFQIRDLAEKNGIPKKFLELILLELKNAGMLSSRRGVGGGYLLARRPDSIRSSEIVEVFEGPMAARDRKKGSGRTEKEGSSPAVSRMVEEASEAAAAVFARSTLADLVREEDDATQRRRSNVMYFI